MTDRLSLLAPVSQAIASTICERTAFAKIEVSSLDNNIPRDLEDPELALKMIQSSLQVCETATTIPIPHCVFSCEVVVPKSSSMARSFVEHVVISGITSMPSTTSLYISVRTQLIANSMFDEHSHIPPVENSKNDCANIVTVFDGGGFFVFVFFFFTIFVFGSRFNTFFFFPSFLESVVGPAEVLFFLDIFSVSFNGSDKFPPCFVLFTTFCPDFVLIVSDDFPLFPLVFDLF